MELAPQQEQAARAVEDWFANSDEQVFYLAGYAGTGKTTIAKNIVERLDVEHCFAAFTGKAAHVLTKKGCPASTIHRLIYIPKTRTEKIKDPITGKESTKTIVEFVLNVEGSPLAIADLCIIDEVSMVDQPLAEDLLSFGVKILVLGDPAQLPPISGAGYFTSSTPDFMLTEIHRQAADNPIIKLATAVREGRTLAIGEYGESSVRWRVEGDACMQANQILVGKNLTRRRYNQAFRRRLGFSPDGLGTPVPGDKIVCLRNNHELGLLNGSLWTVTKCKDEGKLLMDIESEDKDVTHENLVVYPEGFLEDKIDAFRMRSGEVFDYGYALTCHKSQGSQWDHVVVIDESKSFREDRHRWLYTAITRAAEKVTVYMRG